jgi:hypothetical protein
MKIKTIVETTPEEVAQMLCGTSARSELLKLIKEIAKNVDDYDFDKELLVYFTDVITYGDDLIRHMTED